jgi:hypothetical protein
MSRPQGQRDRFEDYVPVAERLERFYERFPEGRITTSIIEHSLESGFVLIRAEVYRGPDDAQPAATGHAFEVRGESYVNKTSYVENAETSAVGRALALLGFEVKRGIASREEMTKAARGAREERAEPAARRRGGDEAAGGESPAAPRPAAAQPPAPAPPADAGRPATDEQKSEILTLLEGARPGDRRAQRRLLTELTGKQSRDDLTQAEAGRFIEELRKGR